MIAIKNAAQKIAVDRPPVYFQELRQFLAPLFERRAAFAGPHEGVEREPRDALRMALREHRRAQRARRNTVDQKILYAARLHNVVGRGRGVVGAVGDVAVNVARLVGAAVAFHVETPRVVAAPGEVVHCR